MRKAMYSAKGALQGEAQAVATGSVGPSPVAARRGRMVAGISAALIALAFAVQGFTGSGEFSEAEPSFLTPPPGAVAAPIQAIPAREDLTTTLASTAPLPRVAVDGVNSAGNYPVSRPTAMPDTRDYPVVFPDAMTTALTNAVVTVMDETPQPAPSVVKSERFAMSEFTPTPAFATPKSM